MVFLVLGLPGVVLALLAWLTLREPPRGLSEPDRAAAPDTPAPSALAIFRHLAVKPAFWHIVAAMALTTFAAAGVGSFLPQYFSRSFSLGLGLTGVMFGLISATSTLVGMVSGGVVVDWLSHRDERWSCWLPGAGVLVAAPMYVASFLLPNPILATAILTLAGASLFLYYAPTQMVLQNMVEPRMRGTAAFIFFLVSSMVGLGFGPALLGYVSDRWASGVFEAGDYLTQCPGGAARAGAQMADGAACHAASAAGLKGAMSVMSCLYVWGAVHFALAARTIRRDLLPTAIPAPMVGG